MGESNEKDRVSVIREERERGGRETKRVRG